MAARALVTTPTTEIDLEGLRAAEAFLAADSALDERRADSAPASKAAGAA
jgi:hypothetical protein